MAVSGTFAHAAEQIRSRIEGLTRLEARPIEVLLDLKVEFPHIDAWVESVFGDDSMQELADGFVDTVVREAMNAAWNSSADGGSYAKFLPEYLNGFMNGEHRPRPKTNRLKTIQQGAGHGALMKKGFEELRGLMNKRVRARVNGMPGAGLGPYADVMRMHLPEHMDFHGGTSSPATSFFYAVEFGTGMYAMGGHDPVTTGDTKESDGSWWYGPKIGRGLHLAGQQGMHFLYDARTGRPKPSYLGAFQREIGGYMRTFFRNKMAKAGR